VTPPPSPSTTQWNTREEQGPIRLKMTVQMPRHFKDLFGTTTDALGRMNAFNEWARSRTRGLTLYVLNGRKYSTPYLCEAAHLYCIHILQIFLQISRKYTTANTKGWILLVGSYLLKDFKLWKITSHSYVVWNSVSMFPRWLLEKAILNCIVTKVVSSPGNG
jgi:hypothetical protein